MNQGIGIELINVPDEEEYIQIVDGEQRVDPIQNIINLRDQLGRDGLTEEELQLLDSYEAANQREPGQHFENLAEHLDDQTLKSIAQKVLTWIQWDENSRAEWQEIEKKGIRLLGVSPNVNQGANFDGASKAVHPLLGEACVQFNSRVMNVLWPAGGPVKTMVMGDKTPELEEQAKRVEGFMNYQYTELMPGAYEQTDKLTLRLPLSGSMFTKVFYDPIDGVTRRLVEPNDFIVPYRATDLKTTSRYTERVMMSQNDVRKRQVAGLYRDIKLIEPSENTSEQNREIVDEEIKATEGRQDGAFYAEDHRRTIYETNCEFDLPGFEDRDENQKLTGIALPYLIVVDKDTQDVLGIYRNWKENDETKRKIIFHTHYRFTQGLGFYGYGFYHWVGSLSTAATGALRALLDAAQFANLQGGFRSKDATLKNGDTAISPGEWREIDASAEDLAKAFFQIPYSEPSVVLFKLMTHIEGLAQRFVGTTETLVGEGSENTPVGTMLARIEQGGKILSAIQERLHQSQREEFKIVAWLDSIYMPDEYPYAVSEESRVVLREDFDERVDVIPVSDPNIVSNAQRFFISQAVLELAAAAPDLYDLRAVHKRALESLRIQNIDELLPDKQEQVQRMGPVQEITEILQGRPIKAFIEQNHEAHIAVHQQYLAMAGTEQQQMIGPMLTAHIQEHMAMLFLVQMSQASGLSIEELIAGEEMPVEVENQIAVMCAQAMQQIQLPQQADPAMMAMEAEQARKDQIAMADMQRKDIDAAAKIKRDDALAKSKITNESESHLAQLTRQNEEQIAELERRANEDNAKKDE